MLRFDKATYLSLLFKIILSVRLSNSLWRSDVLLFSEFINIVFIFVLYPYWIIILLNIFLIVSFAGYKEYIIWRLSFSKFSDVLRAFTCGRATGNLWNICLKVNIFRTLPFIAFIGNIPLLKALSVYSWPA